MVIHVVEAGDTVLSVARRYGTSAARILLDNGLTAESPLVVGQALCITLPAETHAVRPGETLFSIAGAAGLTVRALLQNNPELTEDPILRPGQLLALSFRGGKRRTICTDGYAYPQIDRTLLRRTLPFLTLLSVFSYGFRPDGGLLPAEDGPLIELARQAGTAPILVLTTVGEEGGFSTERAKMLLNEPGLQDRVLENLIAVMRTKGYAGMDVDFEYVDPADRAAYAAFLQNAGAQLRAAGLLLTTAAAPKTYAEQPGTLYEAHDYPALGAAAELVFLMTYEWGYAYGPPMAVAPLPQVRQVAEYAVTAIPREKLLLGIPNYGYDWTLPFRSDGPPARSIGCEEAVRIAAANGAEIRFDAAAQAPYFRYTAERAEHIVWFEDARSIEAKLRLGDELSLRGVGYWNLMRPFAQNWAALAARYEIELWR